MASKQQRNSGPLVIGAGLMRTGTTSQMKALEILLGGKCYHMAVIMSGKRHHLQLWHRAATDGMTKELADEIFEGFNCCTDFPAAHFYQELMQIYPNAKFVLSVRDTKRWVESVRATIEQGYHAVGRMLPPIRWLLGLSYYLPCHNDILGPRLGLKFNMSDSEMALTFARHTESVIQAIPKHRLLVFKVSDGWGPLCEFLDVPVPDVPFPNVNDTANFQRYVRFMNTAAVVGNLTVCAAIGAVAWFGVRHLLRRSA